MRCRSTDRQQAGESPRTRVEVLSSSSYRENSRTCRLVAALAILSLSALAGCGFEPFNAKRDLSSSTVEQMSDVKIALIQADRDQESLPTNPYRVDVS